MAYALTRKRSGLGDNVWKGVKLERRTKTKSASPRAKGEVKVERPRKKDKKGASQVGELRVKKKENVSRGEFEKGHGLPPDQIWTKKRSRKDGTTKGAIIWNRRKQSLVFLRNAGERRSKGRGSLKGTAGGMR